MTMVWADFPSGSDGIYGATTSDMLDGIWGELYLTVSLTADPDTNITGKALYTPSGHARYVLPAAVATAGMASRVWMTDLPFANINCPPIHQYRDGSNSVDVAIYVTTTGGIEAWRDPDPLVGYGSGTLLGGTSGPVLTAGSWRHVESKVFKSATVGTVEVRIEGSVVLDLTGLNTDAANVEQVAFGSRMGALDTPTSLYFKDVVIWNGSGSLNNDFVGVVGVYWLQPDADVSSGWARTSGTTDYELVDESPADDADYIYADDSPPAASIMGVADLPADIVGIKGVISLARAEKSDNGTGNLQVSMTPNGTDYDAGADHAVTTAFTYYADVSEVSPDTAAAWTPTEVDAMYVRLNRTA